MPPRSSTPVILVAFANDSATGANYLRNLPEEARRIRASLEYAEQQGLCEFELRYNVTLDDIVAAFQNPKYQDRIAVLHYGGHAESYNLLFQAADGSLSRIDAHGFAAFLAEQHSLQLVFLNACSTEPQVDDLLAAKVQAVIATSEEVDDAAATDLADAFYQALAHGASIGSAYRKAVAKLCATRGDDPTAFYTLGYAPPVDEPPPAPPDPGAAQPPAAEPPAQASVGADAGQGGAAQTTIQPTSGTVAPAAPSQASASGAAPTIPASAAPTENLAGTTSGGYWPWHLRWRPGAEASVEWSLPIAAGDPLFGLPPLSPGLLPDSPYHRALDYYSRDLAELFFGRGREIRNLYDRVTAAGAASVILYYGQSGVGKSSLLDAGLAPRLANTHTVLYTRRDATLGLLPTLYRQMDQVDLTVSLAQAWRTAEDKAGKPVVLILDQVEELFTRRNPDQPNELADFAAALRTLYGDVRTRPQGALLLGFRKERLAEIESALRDQRIDYAKVYLAPLDANGVEEVVLGPTRSDRLKAKYGLTVDPDLPEVIARDLTADHDSPVAPTLHILLLKLWHAATAQSASQPHFTVALYEHLRRDGILLDDFLRQQIATLAQEQPDAVSSGSLLDLLEYHTTPLGTAEERTTAEVHDRYLHRTDLDAVLLHCKDLYLLADPAGDKVTPASSGTRLAHDTLAPLVRRDFAKSNLPAQQARRLLESRAVDWQNGQTGALLDDAALAVLAKGQLGMRSLTADEQRLVQASTAAQAARARQRRIARIAAFATAALVLALLAVALLARNAQIATDAQNKVLAAEAALNSAKATASSLDAANSRIQAESAGEQARNTQLSKQLADERTNTANFVAKTNEAQRLTQLAQRQLDVDPVLSLNLALQALPESPGDPLLPEAEHMLRQAVLTSRERKWITDTLTAPAQAAFQGDRLAVGGVTPAVYDLKLDPVNFAFPSEIGVVQGLQWGQDDRLLAWNDSAVWVLGGPESHPFATSDGVRCAQWQPAQRWVAVCTDNTVYAWQIDSGRVLTLTDALDPNAWTANRFVAWSSPNGRWLAAVGARLAIWDSQAPGTPALTFDLAQKSTQYPTLLEWLPDGKTVIAGLSSQDGILLQRVSVGMSALEPITIPVAAAAHGDLRALPVPGVQEGSPRLLLWSNDGYLAMIGLDGTLQAEAAYIEPDLRDLVLSPDRSLVLGYSANGTASVWSTAGLTRTAQLNGSTDFQAGRLVAGSWLDDKTVVLADAQGLIHVVNIDPTFLAADSQALGITTLAGYDKTERPALVAPLPAGRVLTVGYRSDGSQPSSIRIWQQAQVPLRATSGLPGGDAPLCSKLQQSLQVTGLISDVVAASWPASDALLLQDSHGKLVWRPLPGEPLVLDTDLDQRKVAVSPNGERALQYGGAENKLWRAGSAAWVRTGSLPGTIVDASWTEAGILAQFSDNSAALVIPDTAGKLAMPGDINIATARAISSTLLLAARAATLDLIDAQSGATVVYWSLPPNSVPLTIDAQPSGTVLYKDTSGRLALLYIDEAAESINRQWYNDETHVLPGEAGLNPADPLIANIDDGVLTVLDRINGKILWRSTTDAMTANYSFLQIRWSHDGELLVARAQPPGVSPSETVIDIWRWNSKQQRAELLQEMPASGMLAISPDNRFVLATEPRRPNSPDLQVIPILSDITTLIPQVQASCLLERPLTATERQDFLGSTP